MVTKIGYITTTLTETGVEVTFHEAEDARRRRTLFFDAHDLARLSEIRTRFVRDQRARAAAFENRAKTAESR